MRITACTPLYPPASRVGAWLATHEFLAGAAAAGHTVIVVPSLVNRATHYELDGVTVLAPRYREAAIRDADVVVSHLGDPGQAHYAAIDLGIPSVRFVHGAPMDTKRMRGAALAVCNSQATADALAWDGSKIVCHPPTDVERYRTAPGDRVTLVNLTPAKGGDLFWHIARTLPSTPFLGVRGGYGGQMVHKAHNVDVVGPTPHMRDEVYSRTRLLIMPSVHEAWGMVAVEAMTSGIPVLARPTPGLRECLGSAGNWVTSNDPTSWSQAVSALLGPVAWQAASVAALARVEELDPGVSIARFIEALEALA